MVGPSVSSAMKSQGLGPFHALPSGSLLLRLILWPLTWLPAPGRRCACGLPVPHPHATSFFLVLGSTHALQAPGLREALVTSVTGLSSLAGGGQQGPCPTQPAPAACSPRESMENAPNRSLGHTCKEQNKRGPHSPLTFLKAKPYGRLSARKRLACLTASRALAKCPEVETTSGLLGSLVCHRGAMILLAWSFEGVAVYHSY